MSLWQCQATRALTAKPAGLLHACTPLKAVATQIGGALGVSLWQCQATVLWAPEGDVPGDVRCDVRHFGWLHPPPFRPLLWAEIDGVVCHPRNAPLRLHSRRHQGEALTIRAPATRTFRCRRPSVGNRRLYTLAAPAADPFVRPRGYLRSNPVDRFICYPARERAPSTSFLAHDVENIVFYSVSWPSADTTFA